jgi:hypothetical protein
MRLGLSLAITQPRFGVLDPDALAYIAAVEAADGEALEPAVKAAYDEFVKGCKQDGIFEALKASCIMAGARTLAGALVPLVGTAPTNNNFVSADYNRVTGLKGDGSTKFLNSNRNNNADPQNSYHQVIWVSGRRSGDGNAGIIGAGLTQQGTSHIFDGGGTITSTLGLRNRTSSIITTNADATGPFIGVFRKSSQDVVVRSKNTSNAFTATSESPLSQNVLVFGRNLGSEYNGRLAFYSIGEDCDESALDTRTTALMTAIEDALT